jgi:hypothetical protein
VNIGCKTACKTLSASSPNPLNSLMESERVDQLMKQINQTKMQALLA